MRTVKCERWLDFVCNVRRSVGYGDRYFRGHMDRSWKLSSPSERRLAAMQSNGISIGPSTIASDNREALRDFRQREAGLFRQHAVGLPGVASDSFSSNDWIALARHNGVVTPLLDWTRSPYVAAWFAVTDALTKANPSLRSDPFFGRVTLSSATVAVWELQCSHALWVESEFELQIDRHALQHRQKAQSAVFTRLDHPEIFDLQLYLERRQLDACLSIYEIDLNPAQVAIAVTDLGLMGINYVAMFPDLHGAALAANAEDFYRDVRISLEKFPGID